MSNLRITWIKSSIGYEKSQKRTLVSLGFHRLNQSVVHQDSSALRGMINKVRHLVKVRKTVVRQDNICPSPGSRRAKKRVGRGFGSGHGAYSGRGCKGQKVRSGDKRRPGFEGGQLPLIKRLPRKRGFFNIFRTEYSTVNIGELNTFEPGSEITPEKLIAAGIVKSSRNPIKILATGDINHPLTVKANKFSASAKAKIEAAGGQVEEVEYAAKAE